MDTEDFNAVLQAAVQAAVQTAMSAVAAQQGAQSATLTVGPDIALAESAAAATAESGAGSGVGGGNGMPYFVPGFGGEGGASVPPGCFDLDDNYNFINRYYRVEQYVFEMGEAAIDGEGLYYISIPATNPSGASIETTSDLNGYNSVVSNLENSAIPLYLVTANDDGGYSVVDLRNIPTAAVWSVNTVES